MTNYYVSTTGNNANAGTSAGSPWATFAYSLTQVAAGDTVFFADGTYSAGSGDTITLTGTSANPIVFRATNSRGVRFDYDSTANNKMDINGSSYVTIQGFIIDANQAEPSGATVRIISSNNINFLDCRVEETKGHGIRIPGNASQILIEDCDFDSNSLPNTQRDGIFIVGSNISGITVRNCTIRRVDHTGVNVGDGDNILVEGCTISATRSHGLSCIDGSNVVFRDNYMYGEAGWSGDVANPYGMQIGIFIHGTCQNVQVYRNIVASNSDEGIYFRLSIVGPVYVWNNTFYDCNKYTGNTTNGVIHAYSITTTTPIIQLRNNIIYNTQAKRAMHLENGSNLGNFTSNYNLWYATTAAGQEVRRLTTTYTTFASYASAHEANSIANSNPDFVNPAADDFTPDTGSPAIDAGVDVGLDYESTAPDIGAVETGAAPPSDPPITGTLLTSGQDTTSGTTSTTASISPAANAIILMSITLNDITNIPPGTPSSITGAGMTWTLVGSVNCNVFSASFSKTTSLYRAMSASPGTGALTINFGKTIEGCSWIVTQHQNVVTTGTNGSGAIAQIANNQEENQTTLDVTLAAFQSADNATYAAFCIDTNPLTLTEEAGFTELGDRSFTTTNLELRHVVAFKNSADTTPTYTAGAQVDYGAIAVELVKATSANNPPTCSTTSPTNGATVTGTVIIQVLATDTEDATGTLTVQVSIAGGAYQTASYNVGSGRYQYSWNTTGLTPGSYTINARATDSGGSTTNATQISVTVSASNSEPTCAITAPTNGATVSGTTTIQVQATDTEDALGTLDVRVSIGGGAYQVATWNAGNSRYQYSWDTTMFSDISYTINARATDSGGLITNAAQISATVSNAGSSGTIDVRHDNLQAGDVIRLEEAGKIEYMLVNSGATIITGGYRYSVIRDLAGTGQQAWTAGDAVVNTQQAGAGVIDMHPLEPMTGGHNGPRIVAMRRNSNVYDDFVEAAGIGNLSGLFGYTTRKIGLAGGDYNGVSAGVYFLADEDGVRVRRSTSQLHTEFHPTTGLIVYTYGSGQGVMAGNMFMGQNPNSPATISHVDLKDSSNAYALSQNSSGQTFVNAAAGQSILLNIASSTRISISLSAWTPAVGLRLGENWVTATLGTNWTNYSTHQPVQYKRIGEFIVIRGSVTSGVNTWQSQPIIFTLPIGHRPANPMMFASISHEAETVSGPVRIDIATNGQVSVWESGSQWIGLNVMFSILSS